MAKEVSIESLRELVVRATELTDGASEEAQHLGGEDFLPEVLDSIGLTTLVTLIEDEWSFIFDDEGLEPELFESLTVLRQAVLNKVGA